MGTEVHHSVGSSHLYGVKIDVCPSIGLCIPWDVESNACPLIGFSGSGALDDWIVEPVFGGIHF